jgi:hypothetical protein
LLIKMVDTTFLIQFRTPELLDQPVIAARAEVRGEHLLLLHSNGDLAAAFMLENVKSWAEVVPDENSIMDHATGERPTTPKNMPPGASGGHARAAALTPEERKAISRKAAAARWNKGN